MARRKIRSTKHHSWAARDGRRAVLAALLLIFVLAASLADGKLIPTFALQLQGSRASLDQKRQPTADDFRTGSILITPREGNICEHRLIDNETWRIYRSGKMQCDDAVAWHAERGDVTWTSRIEAIRDGFFPKR